VNASCSSMMSRSAAVTLASLRACAAVSRVSAASLPTGKDAIDVSDDDLLNLNGKVARYLAAHGASVAVNDFYADRAEEVAAEIRKDGGDALGVQADVTDYASVLAMTSAVAERLGPVTVLVNNAGNARRHPWRDRPQAILGK
jgi:hypothetical protein